MNKLQLSIQILHYEFLGPIPLSDWGPPMEKIIYILFAKVKNGFNQINVDQIDLPAGSDVILDEVLIIEEDAQTKVGTPLVNGASVSATIEAHIRDKKVTYFHYKSKTRQKRMRGHRQHLTLSLIHI